MRSPFPQDTQLTAIAIAVQNRELIADLVLPRTSPLAKSKFSYQYYPPEQMFAVPQTGVGRRGRVNEVDFSGEAIEASTDDYGLEYGLPYTDVRDAPDNTDLAALTTEWLTGLVLLDREVRTSQLVLNPDTYKGNSEVLSPADRFDNPDSDPLGLLLDVLDRPIMRPNVLVMGQSEWRGLRTNASIVKAVHGTLGDKGAASKEQIMELLEVRDIIVGRSLVNIAAPGKSTQMKPCWQGGVALLYQDPTAARIAGQVEGGNVTFGFTAQTGTRLAGQWDDRTIGLRGGTRVRVGETIKEVVCAPSLGFLLQDVIGDADAPESGE